MNKLTAEQIATIQENKESLRVLAERFGVSETAIAYHRKRKPADPLTESRKEAAREFIRKYLAKGATVEDGFIIFKVEIAEIFTLVS